ncbi:hypothetical protein GCM10027580_28220 [Corynebacterium faecale]
MMFLEAVSDLLLAGAGGFLGSLWADPERTIESWRAFLRRDEDE